MHLKQSRFTCSACGPFTKSKEINDKFMWTGNADFIYRIDLDKACLQHEMVYGKSKNFVKRTQSDKAFKIASDPKYDGYQRGLASMIYKFFDKQSSESDVATEPNYQLANELHRQLIRKFKRQKVYSSLNTIFRVLIQLICNH